MPAAAQPQEPPLTVAEVDSPIINSPFREPQYHWVIERGKPPVKAEGRRCASYFYRVPEHAGRGRKKVKQAELFDDAKGEEVELEIVNMIRERVGEWRDGTRSGGVAYDGASPVTKELLELWRSADRMQRLFFAQVEAAETIIFLAEASEIYRKGLPEIPKDEPGLESKASGLIVDIWFAVFTPAGIPAEAERKLTEAVKKAVASPEFVAVIRQTGYESSTARARTPRTSCSQSMIAGTRS